MIKITKNVVKNNELPQGLMIMIYGHPKTRKTSQASEWSDRGKEGTLLIDTEFGSESVNEVNVVHVTSINPPEREAISNGKPVLDRTGLPIKEFVPPEERGYFYTTGENKGQPMPVYSFAEVIGWIQTSVANNELSFDTIIIDTIDEINDWVEEDTCDQLGISAMGQGEFGSDWAMSRNRTASAIQSLKHLLKQAGKNLILISHAKNSSIVKNKVHIGADLPKGLAKKLMGMCDVIGYVYVTDKGESMISFSPYEEAQMGSRIKALHGKTLTFSYAEIKSMIEKYKEGD